MIHILYRHTDNSSGAGKKRPDWFSYNKSLNNILSTIKNINFIKFHLIYDGQIDTIIPGIDHIENFTGGSDQKSFNYAWNYAKKLSLKNDDLIYFLENDYMHINNWPYKIIELYNLYNNCYITLYDHPDKYTRDYQHLRSQLVITPSHHWRTIPSTCGSFIINKQILIEDYDIHTTYYGDHDKFIWLGKNRNRILLSPIPSLSTHCEIEHLSPTIDWNQI
jgi:hypothetical protein